MSRKKSVVALIITVSCLFSIISARMTAKPVATPEHCVIHDLPESMPVLLNTSDGTVGELIPDPRVFPAERKGIVTASYYEFECQYPDFTVTSNSSSHRINIAISKDCIAEYDHQLATQYICENCLRNIEQIRPYGNLLILVKNGEEMHMQWLNDMAQEFSIMNLANVIVK